jgi:hypothetical protein
MVRGAASSCGRRPKQEDTILDCSPINAFISFVFTTLAVLAFDSARGIERNEIKVVDFSYEV